MKDNGRVTKAPLHEPLPPNLSRLPKTRHTQNLGRYPNLTPSRRDEPKQDKNSKHKTHSKVSVKIMKKGEKRGWREGASQPSLDY